MGLHVDVETTVDYGEYNINNKWDRPDTYTTITDVNVTTADEDDSTWNGPGNFVSNASVGDDVYVVIVRYDSGDTFGNDDLLYDVLDVFDVRADAEAFAAWVESTTNEVLKDRKIGPFRHTYNGRNYHYTWIGYFDNFRDVEIYSRVVTQP